MKKKLTALAIACCIAAMPLAACNKTSEEEAELPKPSPEEVIPPAIEEAPPEETEEPTVPTAPAEPLPSEPAEEEPEAPSEPEPEPEPQPQPVPQTADYIVVNTDNLNIRTGAGTNYSSLGTADKGTLLLLKGRSGKWYETRYRGRTAYIHADYARVLRMQKGSDAIEEVVLQGFEYLGVKYVYGAIRYHDGAGNRLSGFSTSAFDCSSLMQFIFYQGAGVLLNVTTRTQVTQGKAVTGELRRGDLMFFTNESRKNNTGVERIGHVALYLGDNYILHTASDYARAEQISAKRWGYYITARRNL